MATAKSTEVKIGQFLVPTVKPVNPLTGSFYYDIEENRVMQFVAHRWVAVDVPIKICACSCPEFEHKMVNPTMQMGHQPCDGCTRCVDFSEDNLEWLLRRDAINKGTVC